MKKCRIQNKARYYSCDGCIINNKVFIVKSDGRLSLPKELFLINDEDWYDYCDGDLTEFEVDNKWGYVDIDTGEIKIEPIYSYATSFLEGYAHVALGGRDLTNEISRGIVEGVKHGVIDYTGKVVIPFEYDFIIDYAHDNYFQVYKSEKWGIVDKDNNIIITMQYDYIKYSDDSYLIFCGNRYLTEVPLEDQYEHTITAYDSILDISTNKYKAKWGVYNKFYKLIIPIALDKEPVSPYIKDKIFRECFILKKDDKYGLISKEGVILEKIELSKRQIVKAISKVIGIEIRSSRSVRNL